MPTLHCEQILPAPLSEVFAFHANPHNLLKITPPALNLHVTNRSRVIMATGATITYQIRWMGLPLNWRTLITDYDPMHTFTDVQTNGPYSKWEHTHTFVENGENSTRVIDDLVYELPFGRLGQLMGGVIIRRQLKHIFAYRNRKLDEIFPGK